MDSVFGRISAAISTILRPAALAAVLAVAGSIALSAPAYAVTIDFSPGSLNGSNGFTVTGYNITNGNCPAPAPCTSIPNSPNVIEISANSGTFDLLSFMYRFQGTAGNGTLTAISNLSSASAGIISLTNPGNPQQNHTYNVIGAMLQYFTNVTWIRFYTDTQANVRIDNVVVAAVPVPAGIALGAAGLGMLGLLGWRRKKAVAA